MDTEEKFYSNRDMSPRESRELLPFNITATNESEVKIEMTPSSRPASTVGIGIKLKSNLSHKSPHSYERSKSNERLSNNNPTPSRLHDISATGTPSVLSAIDQSYNVLSDSQITLSNVKL